MLDGGFDDRVDLRRVGHLILDPLHEVEISRGVDGNNVAVEEIRDHGEVTVRSELISDTA